MPDIKHQLGIGAPPDRVFEAVITQKGLSGWRATDTRARPEVGSVVKFGFNNRQTVFEMEIRGLNSPLKVRWFCRSGHPE